MLVEGGTLVIKNWDEPEIDNVNRTWKQKVTWDTQPFPCPMEKPAPSAAYAHLMGSSGCPVIKPRHKCSSTR